MSVISPPPAQNSLIELDNSPERRTPFIISKEWLIWILQEIIGRIQAAVLLVATVTKTTQAASIGSTTAYTVAQGGLYEIAWYERVTQAATTSSSLLVTVTWREGGQTMTATDAAALTSNTVTSTQSGVRPIRADSGTVITYATTYASVGGTPMNYRLDLTVKRVS